MAQPAQLQPDRPLRILVADPNPDVVYLLSTCLRFQGFEVDTAANGTDALSQACATRPDALILEVELPCVDGFQVLGQLRTRGIDAPVLYVTTHDTVEDKITGLKLGADDYITKPFSLEELTIRLRVILRRTTATSSRRTGAGGLAFGDVELDEARHEASRAGRQVSLSPTEFALLRYFMANPRTVLSKADILANVWHSDGGRSGDVVDVYVSLLRRKIDPDPDKRLIHTLRGVGFIMRESPPLEH
jgi:two-component system OmpR family response regulator